MAPVIRVPNSAPPISKGKCWKSHPGVYDARNMAHCTKPKRHKGRHSWETDAEYTERTRA
jgi:hypothetical protein